MERKYPGFASDVSKADLLQRAVDEASDDNRRLEALLHLARHYVDVGDGVRGYVTARQARDAALKAGDLVAAAHALNSISVSQYHRSEYVSAITTALDAWDYAGRLGNAREIADSHYSIGLSLFGLGAIDLSAGVLGRGVAIVSDAPEFLEIRIRLLRLLGILHQARGEMDDAERLFVAAMKLAEGSTKTQLAACYAYWAIAWLRRMDEQYGGQPVIPEKLHEARRYLQKSLALSEQDGDTFMATDRLALLGVTDMLEGRFPQAEEQLAKALDQARSLDYVRSSVVSAIYLGRCYLQRGNFDCARAVVALAVEQAKRGAADDVIGYARNVLATALDGLGDKAEAEKQRKLASVLRRETLEDRRRATEEAARLVGRILGAAPP